MAEGESSKSPGSNLSEVENLVRLRLPMRELVRSRLVSKEWNAWTVENARLLGGPDGQESGDWYFLVEFQDSTVLQKIRKPLTNHIGDMFRPDPYEIVSIKKGLLTWSGVHNQTNEEHKLPGLQFLSDFEDSTGFQVLACSGALLLLRNVNHWKPHVNRPLVCNPLTKEWRKIHLCEHFRYVLGLEDCIPVELVHMVEDKKLNKYKIYMTSRKAKAYRVSLCVYHSDSDQWVCSPAEQDGDDDPQVAQGVTMSLSGQYMWTRIYSCGSACANGRLYFLDWVGGSAKLLLQVYDMELGRWLPRINCKLQDFDFITSRAVTLGNHSSVKLVECRGDLYAFTPVADFGLSRAMRNTLYKGASGSRCDPDIPIIYVSTLEMREIFGFLNLAMLEGRIPAQPLNRECFNVRLVFYLFKQDSACNNFSVHGVCPLEIVQAHEEQVQDIPPRTVRTTALACTGAADEICMIFGHHVVRYNVISRQWVHRRHEKLPRVSDPMVLRNVYTNVVYKPSFVQQP